MYQETNIDFSYHNDSDVEVSKNTERKSVLKRDNHCTTEIIVLTSMEKIVTKSILSNSVLHV